MDWADLIPGDAILPGRRAVSEALGFLLVFSLILSVSLGVGMAGLGTFVEYTGTEEVRLVEVALTSIRADQYAIATGAPYRSTTVDIGGGTLWVGEPVTITVRASTPTETMTPVTLRSRPLIYALGDSEVVLSAGAVVLDQNDGGVMKKGPEFRIGDDHSYISLINTSYPDEAEVLHGGDVQVVTRGDHRSVTTVEPTDEQGQPVDATVVLSIQTPRHEQWKLFFRARSQDGTVDLDEAERTVSISFNTKRLFISQTEVDVRTKRR